MEILRGESIKTDSSAGREKTRDSDKVSRRQLLKSGVAGAVVTGAVALSVPKGNAAPGQSAIKATAEKGIGESVAQASAEALAGALNWPVLDSARPWAFNWWHGSAVDKENLSRELQRYRDGVLGGIHIIPIYSTLGAEDRDIEYLSPQWMEMLNFTIVEANRLGLGVDMTTGTGWCFGGPTTTREDGGWHIHTRAIEISAGEELTERLIATEVQALMAVSANGDQVDLKPRINADGELDWEAGALAWKLYLLSAKADGPMVKRAAPGGVGPMINPMSPGAMSRFLEQFTQAFDEYKGALPRAMFQDSYEYNSNWSPELPAAFAHRRGYNLQEQLPLLCAATDDSFDDYKSDSAARLRCDYNETLSDLMIEDVFSQWTSWCHARGMQVRYQAHGSPANLLDVYALADMPETEMFGRGTRDPLASGFDENFGEGDRNPLISKFASSAAHVAGRRIVTAETGTWMAEHFCETLEELKCMADLMLVSGINRIVYHGTCYSPNDAEWPGWVFYASTEMNPRNPIWHDAPALNQYLARCQSILQSTRPDNDVLLYWPIHDLWHSNPKLAPTFTVHNHEWLTEQPLGKTAQTLWERGYGFDYISDRQLSSASASEEKIRVAGGDYGVIVVPSAHLMPFPTLEKLLDLARQGCTILFQDGLPTDVPGLADLTTRRAELKTLLDQLDFQPIGRATNAPELNRAAWGRGQVLAGALESLLQEAGVAREPIVDHKGIKFIRKAHDDGWCYFIVNQGTEILDGEVNLGTRARSAVVMDAMSGRTGTADLQLNADGTQRVALRIEPGHSLLLRTYRSAPIRGAHFSFDAPQKGAFAVKELWQVRFLEGGPQLPQPFQTSTLASWTNRDDARTQSFSGTALYSTTFDAPDTPNGQKSDWLLDLGEVCHSARVRLNGQEIGTLLMHPYRIRLENLQAQDNLLEIEVTNLAANRIRDLDQRKVPWRIFRDANVVNINYKPFDASQWPIFDSGLLGPVVVRPL